MALLSAENHTARHRTKLGVMGAAEHGVLTPRRFVDFNVQAIIRVLISASAPAVDSAISGSARIVSA
jgi:hypothetical protein